MCNLFVRPVALMNKITHFHTQFIVGLASQFSRPPEGEPLTCRNQPGRGPISWNTFNLQAGLRKNCIRKITSWQ